MSEAEPGTLFGREGRRSLLRVPNVLFEPRGSFFGGRPHPYLAAVARVRMIGGLVFALGVLAALSQVDDLARDVTAAAWIAVALSVLVLPVVAGFLVVRANPGSRAATLRQLAVAPWTFLLFVGFFAGIGGFAAGIGWLERRYQDDSLLSTLLLPLLGVLVGVPLVLWLGKALYLVAGGLFRADDAHPRLMMFGAPIAAWLLVLPLNTLGPALTGPPLALALAGQVGGALTLTVSSVLTRFYLKSRYPREYPFRDGPLRPAAREARPESAG